MFGVVVPVILIGGIVLAVVVLSLSWEHSRSISMIEQWASRNGLQLVSSSRCLWTLGTPFWAAPKGSTVYRITVEDNTGNRMSGHALWRCGSFFGLWPERVEVKFDLPDFEKRKNDDFEKPKNDFRKRKNDWGLSDSEESESVDLEKLRNEFSKRKNGV